MLQKNEKNKRYSKNVPLDGFTDRLIAAIAVKPTLIRLKDLHNRQLLFYPVTVHKKRECY